MRKTLKLFAIGLMTICLSFESSLSFSQSQVNESTSNENTEVYYNLDELDVKPSYLGGDMALMTFIAKNVRYPQEAREKGIQGSVFVGFVIEEDGTVSNVKVVKGIGGGCDEEAVRVVKEMPKWCPGKKQGKSVRVSYMVLVNFRLG